jgi:hypothetical protein
MRCLQGFNIRTLLLAGLCSMGPALACTSSAAADEGSTPAQDTVAGSDNASAGAAQRPLPPLVDGHRPLRGNPPLADGAPLRDIAAVARRPEDAGFTVVPRLPSLTWYPCQQCHEVIPANTQRRQLYVPHNASVTHGGAEFWCHSCHIAEKEEQLQTLIDEPVGFDQAYQLCAQCHYQPRRDWLYGAHGKRVANWQGEREVYSCTHCHDPHNPALRPRAPQAPPPLRRGLAPLHAHAEATATGEAAPDTEESSP